MCFFDSLVYTMSISNEASYRIGGDGTGYFTETKPTHAICDDPQFFLLVTDVAIFVIIANVAYVRTCAVLIQTRLLEG